MCNSISHCHGGLGGAEDGAGGGWGGGCLFYLESLLMTRMSAPFSSFSLWLSAFKSGSIWKGIKRKQGRDTERESLDKSRQIHVVVTPVGPVFLCKLLIAACVSNHGVTQHFSCCFLLFYIKKKDQKKEEKKSHPCSKSRERKIKKRTHQRPKDPEKAMQNLNSCSLAARKIHSRDS